MKEQIFKNLRGIILFFAFISLSYPVYSQIDVERATREVDRLGRDEEEIEKRMRRAPTKPAEIKIERAPAAKEGKTFFIKKINLAGTESFPPEEFAPLIEKYENKEVSLLDLDILAKDIEQAYLERGIIAAVFVSPQEIKDQTITLQVVEAKMGALETQKQKYFNKDRLSYYWRIKPGEVLHYDKLSKNIKMMNKNPDREVKSTLVAGKKPGTTDVALSAKTNFPIHFTSSFDKEGITSSGKSRIGLGLRDNNLLGLDDMLLAGYTFGSEFSGMYAYHNIPISPFGTALIYGYSYSRSTPAKEYTPFAIDSQARNASVSLYQDLYKKDNYLGEVYLTFDAKDKTITMNTGTYNRDRLRIVRLGGNLVLRDMSSVTYLSPEVSQGVEAFGAMPENNSLASRGGKPSFNKFLIGVQHKRNLPFDLQANLKVKAQYAHQKLTPQEEFGLGGINTVRGYPADDYLGDRAVLTNAELLIPAFFIPASWRLPYAQDSIKEQTTLVAFIDYGRGSRIQPADSDKKTKNLLGMGGGLRFNVFNQALLRLEWGFPIADNRPITESGRSRFHFAVDFQDKLPEELERIYKQIQEEQVKKWAQELVNEELAKTDSALKAKLEGYLNLAKGYQEEGKLTEAKEIYARILEISNSLYQQAEDYVRIALKRQDELKGYRASALQFAQLGRLDEAKQKWQRIIAESAQDKPLKFEF